MKARSQNKIATKGSEGKIPEILDVNLSEQEDSLILNIRSVVGDRETESQILKIDKFHAWLVAGDILKSTHGV